MASRKLKNMRQQLAVEAARIMATESQNNFLAAKQKAAERLGVSNRTALPSNLEVEQALRVHQTLYGGADHDRKLHQLRQTAVDAMRFLQDFSPRLVGPVLTGTAHRHSRVALHVFSDPPDQVVLFLLDRGLPYRQEQRRIRWHDGGYREVPLVVTEADGVSVELSLFPTVDLRQAPPSPVDGRPQQRAAIGEVENLLHEPAASSTIM